MGNLDTLIASIFYLMTRQSQSPKAGLEQAIVDQIRALGEHPNCDSLVLKDACRRLSMTWLQEARLKELGIGTTPEGYDQRRPGKVH